jgi:hypothetical protein
VSLKEYGFDMRSALMISLEGRPDLPSRLKILNTLKLRKRENIEQSISGLAICLMVVNLILTDPNSKHHIVLGQTNLPNSRSKALVVHKHADLPIDVVHAIEPWRVAGPLHVTFVD